MPAPIDDVTAPAAPPRDATARYFGKYRATVVNNVDPERRGRIQVLVPAVTGPALTSWALPCLPAAGLAMGVFTVPIPGAGVWVEFEQGDPDYPIWVGGFWGSAAEVPVLAQAIPPAVPGFVVSTPLGTAVLVSDVPGPTGGILLKTATGALLSISDVGITLSNGQGATITLVGPTVSVNAPALVVT